MTPDFKIVVEGGGDITALIRDRLLSLECVDNSNKQPDRFSLCIDDRDQRISPPKKGAKVRISMGYKEFGLSELGLYVVESVESNGFPLKMTITGQSVDMSSGIKELKSTHYENKSFKEIASEIATRNNLASNVSPELLGIQYKSKTQSTESDMAFLQRIADEHDASLKIANDTVYLAKKGSKKSAGGNALASITIDGNSTEAPGAVKGFSCKVKDSPKHENAEGLHHDSDEPEEDDDNESDRGKSANAGKAQARDRHHAPTRKEKNDRAKSKGSKLKRDQGSASLQLIGDARIRAPMPLTVRNVRRGTIDGEWMTVSVTHKLESSGFSSNVELEFPNDGREDFEGDTARTNAQSQQIDAQASYPPGGV
jgi:hypothetical protein